MSMADPNSHPVKHIIDFAAAGTAAATVFNAMPQIAACFAVAWYIYRFAESLWRRWKGLPQNPPGAHLD